MRANPELDGGVFDLPHIAPAATEAAEAEGLDHRFTAVGGGFFASVPSADLYALKYILHDWDDASCVRILQNCRVQLAKGGRIAVVELLAEFDALFTAAGPHRVNVTPAGAFAVIEAQPIA
jgi:hypothetical protein